MKQEVVDERGPQVLRRRPADFKLDADQFPERRRVDDLVVSAVGEAEEERALQPQRSELAECVRLRLQRHVIQNIDP